MAIHIQQTQNFASLQVQPKTKKRVKKQLKILMNLKSDQSENSVVYLMLSALAA